MDAIDMPPVASAKQGKRRLKVIADDHMPAVLAASDGPAAPVVSATVPSAPFVVTEPIPEVLMPVEPALVAVPTNRPLDVVDTAFQQTTNPSAVLADLTSRARGTMPRGLQMFEEMNAFGKGNMEALVESSKIAAKGVETLGQETADLARRQVESATQAIKTLAATKSPTEFMKLQSDYVRSMFDTMVAETSRSTEKMIKLASDIAQPISNRVAVASEKVKLAA